MRVILFIGHHKVGSTALQAYLAQNAIALLRQGVLYPAVEGQGQATQLAMAMSGEDQLDAPLPINFREAHNALAFAMLAQGTESTVPELHQGLPGVYAMLTTIRRQVEMFQPHTVILAAEVFANFTSQGTKLIRKLANTFPKADITVTATLRRVDDYLVSWHGQRMRFGHKTRTLSDGALRHYAGTIHFDYRKMLEGWRKELPEASLRLRSYSQVRASGGSVSDFFDGFGVSRTNLDNTEPEMNKSLHRGLIELARRGNHALPPGQAAELFRKLLELGPKIALPRADEIEMYGTEARGFMTERFAPIHDWLSMVSGQDPFFADGDQIGRLLPHPEREANRIALEALRGPLRGQLSGPLSTFLRDLDLEQPVSLPA